MCSLLRTTIEDGSMVHPFGGTRSYYASGTGTSQSRMKPSVTRRPALTLLLLVLSIAVLGQRPPDSVSAQSPGTWSVQVRADQGWQSTGVSVQKGDTVEIKYVSGSWTQTAGKEPYHDGADNSAHYICADYVNPSICVEPIPDFPAGALIGRVGNRLLKVGNSLRFVADSSGILYLRMNDGDDALNDNVGSLTVAVTVQPPDNALARQFTVQAHLGWQDTGITLAPGDGITIQYVAGSWTGGIGAGKMYDGNGDLDAKYRCSDYSSICAEPMPSVYNGTLVGRVGSSVFAVGNYYSSSPGSGGSLQLRMNDVDGGLFDNSGALIVRIAVGTPFSTSADHNRQSNGDVPTLTTLDDAKLSLLVPQLRAASSGQVSVFNPPQPPTWARFPLGPGGLPLSEPCNRTGRVCNGAYCDDYFSHDQVHSEDFYNKNISTKNWPGVKQVELAKSINSIWQKLFQGTGDLIPIDLRGDLLLQGAETFYHWIVNDSDKNNCGVVVTGVFVTPQCLFAQYCSRAGTTSPESTICARPPEMFDPPDGRAFAPRDSILRWRNYQLQEGEVYDVLVWPESGQPKSLGRTTDQTFPLHFLWWDYAGVGGKFYWTIRVLGPDGKYRTCDGLRMSFTLTDLPVPPKREEPSGPQSPPAVPTVPSCGP